MWLLNAETRKLEQFMDGGAAGVIYAILSHTWGQDEVSFADIHRDDVHKMKGYAKILFACDQALQDDIQWVWVDTCCIDKRSSAELSEAINSMYRWYYDAQVCYAYLDDVNSSPLNHWSKENPDLAMTRRKAPLESTLPKCRWFTRGWTLQELIAPHTVRFYDSIWTYLGQKSEAVKLLSKITKISEAVLDDRDCIKQASIANRMAWASVRQTTRIEDQTYCLLGLFDVNMPLLYGEGNKAFGRLQEEIIRAHGHKEQDQSIFAWSSHGGSLLALSPAAFEEGALIRSQPLSSDESYELSSKGLHIRVLARPDDDGCSYMAGSGKQYESITIALNCRYDHGGHIAMRLRRRPRVQRLGLHLGMPGIHTQSEFVYDRMPGAGLMVLSAAKLQEFTPMDLIISRLSFDWPPVLHAISLTECEAARLWTWKPEHNVKRSHHPRSPVILLATVNGVACGSVSLCSFDSDEAWPDVSLFIKMDARPRPPHLFIKGSASVMSESAEVSDAADTRVFEGEELVVSFNGMPVLRVVARFVLFYDDLLFNLEMIRPGTAADFPKTLPSPQQQNTEQSAAPISVQSPRYIGKRTPADERAILARNGKNETAVRVEITRTTRRRNIQDLAYLRQLLDELKIPAGDTARVAQ